MKIYQIKDWNEHFENDRSRSRKVCSFVCVPNKQHGMGFIYIMSQTDGAAIYGIWCCIIGAASQQKSRNGWLTENGEPTGRPWTAEDLAMKFRRPSKEIERALQVIVSDMVGWISAIDNLALTAHSPPTPLERRKEEKEGNEGRRESDSAELLDEKSCLAQAWNDLHQRRCDSYRKCHHRTELDRHFIFHFSDGCF